MFDANDHNLQYILDQEGTPLIIFDLSIIQKNIKSFKNLFPDFQIFYSTKTNSEPAIIDTVHLERLNYDAASLGEIQYLIGRGVPPRSILFTHPIKLEVEVKEAIKLGIDKFTFDSKEELNLLTIHAPKKSYFLRILPKTSCSLYDYGGKFGASPKEIKQILNLAIAKKIAINGLSFHVGTQTMSLQPWGETLSRCLKIIKKYYKLIPSLRTINIGSGFPVPYTFATHVSLDRIATFINLFKKKFPSDISFWAEPGRILVADSAILITEIINNIKRGRNNWLYTDTGVYHGLIEILESNGKFSFAITSFKKGKRNKYFIAGKTLDPDDLIAKEVLLPSNLKQGDKLIIHDVGAYTTMFICDYHFLKKPKICFIDSTYNKNVELGTSKFDTIGLKTLKSFKTGELIFTVTGHFTKQQSRTSFQVEKNLHIEPTLFGRYLNHSCSPNVGIKTNGNKFLDIVAVKDISAGEEIVVDYAMFDYETVEMRKVRCNCRSHNCRVTITGFKGLPLSKKREYKGFISDYLLNLD